MDPRSPSESQPRLIALNAAVSAGLQAAGHRLSTVRLLTVFSPAVGRVGVAPLALDDLISELIDTALAATKPGGTVIVETEQIDAEAGISLADATLAPGSYALMAVSSVAPEPPAPAAANVDRELDGANWSEAVRSLGGGAWVDIEHEAAIAFNVLLPCASGARIRLPNALMPVAFREGY